MRLCVYIPSYLSHFGTLLGSYNEPAKYLEVNPWIRAEFSGRIKHSVGKFGNGTDTIWFTSRQKRTEEGLNEVINTPRT